MFWVKGYPTAEMWEKGVAFLNMGALMARG
jgi:hypothetical protein